MEKNIFAIIRIFYNPTNKEKLVWPCGTCFFIDKQKFITAHHCFNESSYGSYLNYSQSFLILVNSLGKIICNPSIDKLYPDYDLAIGRIDEENDYFSISNFLLSDYKAGDEVFNVGFPKEDSIISYNIMENDLLVSDFIIKPSKQSGKIDDIKNETYNDKSDEIKIIDKKVIIPNYTSRTGFSGGPLFDLVSNKIIGYMSLVPSNSQDSFQRVRSIALSEIIHLL